MVKMTDWRYEFRKLQLINEKLKQRIKKLKLDCGQQATKICVLNLRIKELEEIIGLAIGGIDAFVGFWSDAQVKKDMLAIKETLEQALVKSHT